MRVTALLFCALAGAVGASDAPAGLVGTWKLVAYEDTSAQGAKQYPFGESPVGLAIYDATGHMSMQVMKRPHPTIAGGDESKATPAEKAALFDAYMGYFGTYTVDMAKGVVTHHVEGDLYDLFVGKHEERPFELSGDRLVLKPRWTLDGVEWSGYRAFQRVR